MTDPTDMFYAAKARMEKRFMLGEQQEQILLGIVAKTVIVDKLVPPKMTGFLVGADGQLRLKYFGVEMPVTIHRHALGQLCAKVDPALPANFVNGLLGGNIKKKELLAYSLEALFAADEWLERGGQPLRFLHRLVGGELRGFLSHRFARHLLTAPLLRSFIDACAAAGARAVEAVSSPVRSSLKCLMPKVFEVFPGEYITVGVEFVNSDFGAGRLAIRSTVWRVNAGTAYVLDETFSKVHIGSVIEDSDLILSEGTWQKETEAQRSVIVDVVGELLSEKTIQRLLQALRFARDEQIPWSKLRARLKDTLSKSDLDWMQQAADNGGGIVDLPPISYNADGSRSANLYWAAGAVSALASRTEDPDRRIELQREAGKLLADVLGREE